MLYYPMWTHALISLSYLARSKVHWYKGENHLGRVERLLWNKECFPKSIYSMPLHLEPLPEKRKKEKKCIGNRNGHFYDSWTWNFMQLVTRWAYIKNCNFGDRTYYMHMYQILETKIEIYRELIGSKPLQQLLSAGFLGELFNECEFNSSLLFGFFFGGFLLNCALLMKARAYSAERSLCFWLRSIPWANCEPSSGRFC